MLFTIYPVFDTTTFVTYQDFSGSERAHLVEPAFALVSHLTLLTQFVVKSKSVDSTGILVNRYDAIVESMALLVRLLLEQERRKLDFSDENLAKSMVVTEPGLRFHLKWHRQLVHLSQLYLRDVLKCIGKTVTSYHFVEHPEISSFVENFARMEEEEFCTSAEHD